MARLYLTCNSVTELMCILPMRRVLNQLSVYPLQLVLAEVFATVNSRYDLETLRISFVFHNISRLEYN
jgi:hypothetical protein